MPFPKKKDSRLNAMCIILASVLAVYSLRLISLQLWGKQENIIDTSGLTARTATLKAPRGEILDSYGRELAVNREGYNVVFNSAYIDRENLNDTILSLAGYFAQNQTEWIDRLPLEKEAPYGYSEEDNSAFLSAIGLAHYATAENAFEKLIETYSLENYSEADARIIMGVRYSMARAQFSVVNPYTFAEDIPAKVMQGVSENGYLLKGVTVDTAPVRYYSDSAPVHIIGTVGPIYAEEWYGDKEKNIVGLKDKGYTYSDKVGKSGIEAYCEDVLKGTDGQITYYIDDEGTVVKTEITKEPIPGKTVMLTLDKKIQNNVQNALNDTVRNLNANGGKCTGGAAVVMNVKTGQILASANNPTFDFNTYLNDYESIANAPNNPLINRAFQGVYPIGSTIKPIVAIAGIDNKLLTADEHINCVKRYTLFSDYQPSCMGTHGHISLTSALARSCNYYFFEVGRRVGATKLGEYFNQFGLGVKTGVEIGDSKGIYVQVDEGNGDTLQISIGQKNAFTPLQLAVYTATLANGGTRYKATLINKIVTYDLSENIKATENEVLNKVEISDYAISSVKRGMLSVTEDGTGSTVFGSYPIKVGGKTGTSQNTGIDHSIFIAFAPFDNPEIAVAVVLEHGNSGFAAGTVVKAALDAHFFSQEISVDTTTAYTPLQ
jgi:penicillin-binding protein 2